MAPTFSRSGSPHATRLWTERLLARLAGCLCLLSGISLLAGGCSSGPPREVERAEVTGKVTFKSKALPGGKVTFVTTKWGFSGSGDIDENGQYKVNAPVGDVLIAVDNRILAPPKKEKGKKEAPKPPPIRLPGDPEPAPPPKGKYVKIPDKYADPSKSGLTFKVEKGGPQTHDINLD
jgi:hypothetical protein